MKSMLLNSLGFPFGWCLVIMCLPAFGLHDVLHAQIGLPEKEAHSQFNLTERKYSDFPGSTLFDVTSKNNGSKLPFELGFRNGVESLIRLHQYTLRIGLKDVANTMVTFGQQYENGKVTNIKWKQTDAFRIAFPPLGNSYTYTTPLTRSIGQQRTVTVNSNTGQVLGTSPWSDLRVPTGEIRFDAEAECLFVEILVSDNGKFFGVVNAYEYHSTAAFFGEREQIHELFICDAASLWDWAYRRMTEKTVYDAYENRLRYRVTEKYLKNTNINRLGALFTGLVDESDLSTKELLIMANNAIVKEGAVKDAFREQLLLRLTAQSPDAQSRRIKILVEMYGPDVIGDLVSIWSNLKLRRSKSYRKVCDQIESLLRQLAKQHQLPDPPESGAKFSDWESWSAALKG